ncbi:hypothetical protein [Roseovarius aestuariivivens]|uniref:hypothetical protein n=1 Tax=Roseovarius aestuariivivens TaxID=1888910 RepID=UPI001080497C|nr:hypothetical protein [Roseovarius aestuariivivens]
MSDLVSEEYGMIAHAFRDATTALAGIAGIVSVDLAFVSADFEAHDMADLVQDVLGRGANVILINGLAAENQGPVGFLQRPYSSDDIGRIVSAFV